MTETATIAEMANRTIIIVHGRDFKPAKEELGAVWMDAIRWGLQRDCPDMVERFDAARKENAYYGDLTNTVLSANRRSYDEALDLADRRNALEALKTLDKRKRFSGARYDRLPGKTSLKEFVADVATPILRTIGLTGYVISKLVPELAAYWDTKDDYDEAVHARITEAVIAAMNREDRILVISHGIGAIPAIRQAD